jgi:MarR family transcriptional regulator, organic hydroperoxide resistance regulator
MRRGRAPSGKEMKATAAAKTAWFAAMRWRAAVESELAAVDATFTQWLVLDATDELERETGDAITQNAIAARTQLDKMTVSLVARKLEQRGWLDRAPASGRPALRVLVTTQGRRAVADARTRVEAATKRLQHEEARGASGKPGSRTS